MMKQNAQQRLTMLQPPVSGTYSEYGKNRADSCFLTVIKAVEIEVNPYPSDNACAL